MSSHHHIHGTLGNISLQETNVWVSCAPEMYNKIIQQTMDGCDGVQSIFDDLVVHGKTTEEHNKRLENVL